MALLKSKPRNQTAITENHMWLCACRQHLLYWAQPPSQPCTEEVDSLISISVDGFVFSSLGTAWCGDLPRATISSGFCHTTKNSRLKIWGVGGAAWGSRPCAKRGWAAAGEQRFTAHRDGFDFVISYSYKEWMYEPADEALLRVWAGVSPLRRLGCSHIVHPVKFVSGFLFLGSIGESANPSTARWIVLSCGLLPCRLPAKASHSAGAVAAAAGHRAAHRQPV